jgi:hypothetical protein
MNVNYKSFRFPEIERNQSKPFLIKKFFHFIINIQKLFFKSSFIVSSFCKIFSKSSLEPYGPNYIFKRSKVRTRVHNQNYFKKLTLKFTLSETFEIFCVNFLVKKKNHFNYNLLFIPSLKIEIKQKFCIFETTYFLWILSFYNEKQKVFECQLNKFLLNDLVLKNQFIFNMFKKFDFKRSLKNKFHFILKKTGVSSLIYEKRKFLLKVKIFILNILSFFIHFHCSFFNNKNLNNQKKKIFKKFFFIGNKIYPSFCSTTLGIENAVSYKTSSLDFNHSYNKFFSHVRKFVFYNHKQISESWFYKFTSHFFPTSFKKSKFKKINNSFKNFIGTNFSFKYKKLEKLFKIFAKAKNSIFHLKLFFPITYYFAHNNNNIQHNPREFKLFSKVKYGSIFDRKARANMVNKASPDPVVLRTTSLSHFVTSAPGFFLKKNQHTDQALRKGKFVKTVFQRNTAFADRVFQKNIGLHEFQSLKQVEDLFSKSPKGSSFLQKAGAKDQFFNYFYLLVFANTSFLKKLFHFKKPSSRVPLQLQDFELLRNQQFPLNFGRKLEFNGPRVELKLHRSRGRKNVPKEISICKLNGFIPPYEIDIFMLNLKIIGLKKTFFSVFWLRFLKQNLNPRNLKKVSDETLNRESKLEPCGPKVFVRKLNPSGPSGLWQSEQNNQQTDRPINKFPWVMAEIDEKNLNDFFIFNLKFLFKSFSENLEKWCFDSFFVNFFKEFKFLENFRKPIKRNFHFYFFYYPIFFEVYKSKQFTFLSNLNKNEMILNFWKKNRNLKKNICYNFQNIYLIKTTFCLVFDQTIFFSNKNIIFLKKMYAALIHWVKNYIIIKIKKFNVLFIQNSISRFAIRRKSFIDQVFQENTSLPLKFSVENFSLSVLREKKLEPVLQLVYFTDQALGPLGPAVSLLKKFRSSPQAKLEPFGPQAKLKPFGPQAKLEPFGPQAKLEPYGPEASLEPFAPKGKRLKFWEQDSDLIDKTLCRNFFRGTLQLSKGNLTFTSAFILNFEEFLFIFHYFVFSVRFGVCFFQKQKIWVLCSFYKTNYEKNLFSSFALERFLLIYGNKAFQKQNQIKKLKYYFSFIKIFSVFPNVQTNFVFTFFKYLKATQYFNKNQTKFLLLPTYKSLKNHLKNLKALIMKSYSKTQFYLIQKLALKISQWCYCYRILSNFKLFYYCDNILLRFIWKWAVRIHPNKSKKWIQKKYFLKIVLPSTWSSPQAKLEPFGPQVFGRKLELFEPQAKLEPFGPLEKRYTTCVTDCISCRYQNQIYGFADEDSFYKPHVLLIKIQVCKVCYKPNIIFSSLEKTGSFLNFIPSKIDAKPNPLNVFHQRKTQLFKFWPKSNQQKLKIIMLKIKKKQWIFKLISKNLKLSSKNTYLPLHTQTLFYESLY